MRSKLLGGAAALALTACTVVASVGPASAQHWRGRGYGGFGLGAGIAAGIIGGAVVAATAPGYYGGYYPGYAYGPGYGYDGYGGYGYGGYGYGPPPPAVVGPGPGQVVAGGATAYCESRFRSYDPASGTYLGFDGQRHPCP